MTDTTADTSTTDAPVAANTKATTIPARTRWTAALEVKILANRPADSLSVVLYRALRSCNVGAPSIDTMLGVPVGSTIAYLTSGEEQPGLTHAQADLALDCLFELKKANAFKGSGLHIEATLVAMNAIASLERSDG